MKKVEFCCVTPEAYQTTSEPFSAARTRLDHTLIAPWMNSCHTHATSKLLEGAEKGMIYSLEGALTRGAIPYATKVQI